MSSSPPPPRRKGFVSFLLSCLRSFFRPRHRVLVTIPVVDRGNGKFPKYMAQARESKKSWKKTHAKTTIRLLRRKGLEPKSEKFWLLFDLKKLEILLCMLKSNLDRECVCVVADADVSPGEHTIFGLENLPLNKLGLGKGKDPQIENYLIAARPTQIMIECIQKVLEVMNNFKCNCDAAHHHSFQATVTLLPFILFFKVIERNIENEQSLKPPCPHNCHWINHIRETIWSVEHTAPKQAWAPRPIPVNAPLSAH